MDGIATSDREAAFLSFLTLKGVREAPSPIKTRRQICLPAEFNGQLDGHFAALSGILASSKQPRQPAFP